MGKQYKSGKSSGGKKILLTIGVLALLVLLFFLSFWITGIVLRANQGPLISQEATETGAPTPKPTYEELEKELASYRLDGTPAPNKTTAPSFTTGQNPTAKPKETPVAKPSVKPTAKPTAVPTAKPTVAPTPVPTAAPAAPTKTPVQILPPGLQ